MNVNRKTRSLISTFVYLDVINLGNSIHYKSVIYKIPPYYKGQSTPIILYAHTIPIPTKLFNYKKFLLDLNIFDFQVQTSKVPHSHVIRMGTF